MKATVTFDPYRLQEALDEEMAEHHRHSSSGRCQCNRSTTKDPSEMRAHLAAELMAVILRFQGEVPEKESPEDVRARQALAPHYDRLYVQWRELLRAGVPTSDMAILVPSWYPPQCQGGTMFGITIKQTEAYEFPNVIDTRAGNRPRFL